MTSTNIPFGKLLHTYRKAQGMTLEELAEKICKSKSTVGKYEQGLISVEYSVLLDLAKALGIRPQQLLADPEEQEDDCFTVHHTGRKRYFYSYDGYSRRMMRALMIVADGDDKNSAVSFFYDIPSFDQPERCRVLYVGHQESHETITKYLLKKRDGIESPQMVFSRPLDYAGKEAGMFFGISSRTQMPVALKSILSDEPLAEDEALIAQLKVTSEDLKLTRKLNQFTIEPFFSK